MDRVAIVAAPDREHAAESAADLARRLRALGVGVQVATSPVATDQQDEVYQADLIVVMGGDGSLIGVARDAAHLGTPVLGVDMGSFGFLAETKYELLCARLEEVLAGDYAIESRPLLSARVMREGHEAMRLVAMNEVTVARTLMSSPAQLQVYVAGEFVSGYVADALIVATSTGSTAYSLSAGGPIVDPSLEAVVIVPVCPHTLHARPLVAAADVEVNLRLQVHDPRRADLRLTVDGQIVREVHPGDRVLLTRARHRAHLVRLDGESFYHKLRAKLF